MTTCKVLFELAIFAILLLNTGKSEAVGQTLRYKSTSINMTEPQEACIALSSFLGNKTSVPGSEAYSAAVSSYFSAQEQEVSPACIVAPASTAEVAQILKILAKYPVSFAIRGGGHTLNAGAANIDSGVTINLRSINQVTVNEAKTLVSIGGGAKWGEVYPVLDALNLATSGGRVSDVGVGGLTTGGGISYFSGREGLVCDNVENYEVVLADGSIVNANRTENNDLWIALKGGSSNFGIVTRFDIRTFPQGAFYGGVIVSPITTIDAQLKGYASLIENFDPYAALIMSVSWNQVRNGFSIFTNIEYTKNNTNPVVLQPFLQVQPQLINTMRVSNLSDFATESAKYAAPGLRNQFATTTFGGGLEFLNTVYSIWKSSISGVSSINGTNWAMVIQPFPEAFISSSTEANSLGLSRLSGPQTLFLLSYSWASAEDDEKVTTLAQKLINDIDAAARKVGAGSNFKYLNYAAYWQNPIAGYGPKNLQNLEEVSKRYDPKGFFQHKCPGGFKISKS